MRGNLEKLIALLWEFWINVGTWEFYFPWKVNKEIAQFVVCVGFRNNR